MVGKSFRKLDSNKLKKTKKEASSDFDTYFTKLGSRNIKQLHSLKKECKKEVLTTMKYSDIDLENVPYVYICEYCDTFHLIYDDKYNCPYEGGLFPVHHKDE